MNSRKYLTRLFRDGLESCSPDNAVTNALRWDDKVLSIYKDEYEVVDPPIFLFATGKASIPMYESAAQILDGVIRKSLVVTSDADNARRCSADEVLVGAHPTPDESSIRAGKKACDFFNDIPSGTFLITLISGGTSSLLCLPPESISTSDINKTFELLNECGATIREINTVRKHCSQIKGGQLLNFLDPTVTLLDLVISDVPDDDLSIIGSGPTIEDSSTFAEAKQVLEKYELWGDLPDAVENFISDGAEGEISETVKPGNDPLVEHSSYVISSAKQLARSIGNLASDDGLRCRIADAPFNEDVEIVAEQIADIVTEDSSAELFVFYGESTVSVTGSGKGGRNIELALRGAMQIKGREDITWLSVGTDGIDGPTDAAGAIVDGKTIHQAGQQGMDPKRYLADNDSYHFHEKMGTLLKTGPTGNNLMDLVLIKTGD